LIFTIIILTLLLDQITKAIAVKKIALNGNYEYFGGLIEFKLVKNFGAAFGILQDKRWLFIIITTVVILVFIIYIVKFNSEINLHTKLALSLLLGGAIGNFIDRIRLGYVIDFIQIDIINSINFPVFNFADVFIVFGTIMLMIFTIYPRGSLTNGEKI